MNTTKKLLILAPSAGGKSTLMRYLREHTKLKIAETDEEVMKANNDVWPDDKLKNEILVPQTTKEIISRPEVVYFASYIPDEQLKEARDKGFKTILLDLTIEQLAERNKKRMSTENYQDATPWLQLQLDTFKRLQKEGLVDEVIDGNQSVEDLAKQIQELSTSQVSVSRPEA
jgi:dephospho-CoA kinase